MQRKPIIITADSFAMALLYPALDGTNRFTIFVVKAESGNRSRLVPGPAVNLAKITASSSANPLVGLMAAVANATGAHGQIGKNVPEPAGHFFLLTFSLLLPSGKQVTQPSRTASSMSCSGAVAGDSSF